MADPSNRWKQNAPGPYYVDDQCIACDACIIEAEEFFEMNDEDGHAYVKRQPTSDEEKEECENALESCPVEAIGRDG
ncbi:MAG: ferredoxin [Bacteriovoracales bacterium]|nr:ferredoxin [Bacteriovoracales bacterium]